MFIEGAYPDIADTLVVYWGIWDRQEVDRTEAVELMEVLDTQYFTTTDFRSQYRSAYYDKAEY